MPKIPKGGEKRTKAKKGHNELAYQADITQNPTEGIKTQPHGPDQFENNIELAPSSLGSQKSKVARSFVNHMAEHVEQNIIGDK